MGRCHVVPETYLYNVCTFLVFVSARLVDCLTVFGLTPLLERRQCKLFASLRQCPCIHVDVPLFDTCTRVMLTQSQSNLNQTCKSIFYDMLYDTLVYCKGADLQVKKRQCC